MKIEDLISLQEEIQERKTQGAQLEGERTAIMKQLKTDWGCTTIKQAEKLLQTKEEEIEELEKSIESGLDELEEKLKLIK